MNLTEMLKDASLADHSWLLDGLTRPGEFTFDPEAHDVKNPNNTKPELEIEWGYGGMSPVFQDDPSAGEVERNIPPEDIGDAEEVIRFARDLMNRGNGRRQVVRAMCRKFPVDTMIKAKDEIKSLFSLDGIIGRVAIDARGYGSCREALETAAASPYKRFIKYVIGCDCGDPQMIHSSHDGGLNLVESSGNALDDFFGQAEPDRPVVRAHCRSTMLPILSGMGDLDESEMDSTLIDLMNVTGLPDGVAGKDMADTTTLKKVRDAFRAIDRTAERRSAERYEDGVSGSEFVLKAADNEIDIAPSVARPDLEMKQERSSSVDRMIEFDPLMPVLDSLKADVVVEIDSERQVRAQEVNPVSGELEISFDGIDDIDIDMTPLVSGIFMGADEIELDEPKAHKADMSVDMRQDMVV